MAFGRAFSRAFEQGVPIGFQRNEQLLREQLLQEQLDEAQFQRETRGLAQEAGAAARAAPIYESAPTTAPDAQGALQTSNAPAPERPAKARPMWLERDALRAQAQVLIERGQQETGARLMMLADQQFDRGMKQLSDNALRALEGGDLATAVRLYDEGVPDGMRVQNWKQGKDGAVELELVGAGGATVKDSMSKDELRALIVGLTDPAKIQELRDKAVERESALFATGIGAALQGNMELAQKLLGGPVAIQDTTNSAGVKDQMISLPDGRQMLRSQFEKIAPWAMQEQGNKLKKFESDMQTADVERGLKLEQAKTEGARRNQLNAYAQYLRGKGLGGGGAGGAAGSADTSLGSYEKFRKDAAPIFENDQFTDGRTPAQATDLYAQIQFNSARARAAGVPNSEVPPPILISAIRAGGDAVILDRTAKMKGPDGKTFNQPAWIITDPNSGTKYAVPALGIAPSEAQPAPPKPASRGLGEVLGQGTNHAIAPTPQNTGPLPPPAASPIEGVKSIGRGLWNLLVDPK